MGSVPGSVEKLLSPNSRGFPLNLCTLKEPVVVRWLRICCSQNNYLSHQNKWILITCCLCAAVSNVLRRSPHKLGETIMKVSALKPQPPPSLILNEPIDEERLLAKKLPPGCSLQQLQTFISRATTSQIICWRIGVKPTTALLEFDCVPGIHSACVYFNYMYDTLLCVICVA